MTRVQKYYDNNKTKHNTILLWDTAGAKLAPGWGLLSQIPLFHYFPNFSESWKHCLPNEYQYHIYIWEV